MAGVGVAARLPIGVHLDRAIDRDAIPARHGHTDLERGMRESGERFRDEVLSRSALVELLEQERQEGGFRVVRAREDVVGVEVAQVGKGVDHLVVELTLGHIAEMKAEQLEPLDRVDGVH